MRIAWQLQRFVSCPLKVEIIVLYRHFPRNMYILSLFLSVSPVRENQRETIQLIINSHYSDGKIDY